MGYGANNQQCFGHLKMTMRSAIAEIRESFDVMDSDKVGYIDVERLQTICLGLGYGRIAVDELASMVSDRSHITLKDTVSLLSKVGNHFQDTPFLSIVGQLSISMYRYCRMKVTQQQIRTGWTRTSHFWMLTRTV